jgi:twitching motility protein PilU
MQSFDQDLHRLYREGLISNEDALKYADSPNDLRLKIKTEDGISKEVKFDLS